MNIKQAKDTIHEYLDEEGNDAFFRFIPMGEGYYAYAEPWTTDCFSGPNEPDYSDMSPADFDNLAVRYMHSRGDEVVRSQVEQHGYSVVDIWTGRLGYADEVYGTTVAVVTEDSSTHEAVEKLLTPLTH